MPPYRRGKTDVGRSLRPRSSGVHVWVSALRHDRADRGPHKRRGRRSLSGARPDDRARRLLLNTRHLLATREATPSSNSDSDRGDFATFCEIILGSGLDQATQYVARRMAEGASYSAMLLELFTPTARRLGELWESDERSFSEVTLALGKLQQLLRLFSGTYSRSPVPETLGFRALLATLPGNQHVFGLLVVAELFRRSGWNVLALTSPSRSELIDRIAREWFAVVGLSISCDESAATVATLIAQIRAASLNKSVLVLVGGRYVTGHPSESLMLGADLVGVDAQYAIEKSQQFLASIGR